MSDAASLSDLLAAAVKRDGASIVRIDGRCASTSGTVWSADGAIVTAHHSLGRAEEFSVTLGDGRSVKATVVGRDAGTDLAVLRAEATGLPAPTWSDGASLEVGHIVLPLGRPGRSVRATLGMVSALGDAFRTATGGTLDRYIEVDANLPRGFSGGALSHPREGLLGIDTAGLVRGGATIPTATLRRVVPELLANGRVGRGYLGVSVYPARIPEGLREAAGVAQGVAVVGLEANSPAARDGVLVGDVIVSVEGQAIEGPGDLLAVLDGRAGATLTLRVVRAGALTEVKVTAGPTG